MHVCLYVYKVVIDWKMGAVGFIGWILLLVYGILGCDYGVFCMQLCNTVCLFVSVGLWLWRGLY